MTTSTPTFGGSWTIKKLDILEHYLDTYTTALKAQRFKLMYIDAFAGTGQIVHRQSEENDFIVGSAERAAQIDNKPFDKLIFVEKDPNRSKELMKLKEEHPDRNIVIENADANMFLSDLDEDWNQWRGVLFLDPFATAVKWKTIERIASFNALDTWILFPVSAIMRILPGKICRPQEVPCVGLLSKIFGDETWQDLYDRSLQKSFLSDPDYERKSGTEGLLEIYKGKLASLFGERFLKQTRPLKNSKKSILFEFMFCAGHPSGINLAKRIAAHILSKL